MQFKGINHLALITGDMEATIRFWRDLLGMRLIHGFGEPGFRHYFFAVDEKTCVSFFEWQGVQPAERKLHGRPVTGPVVFDHLAFGLDSAAAVWDLRDRLEAAGFPCSDMIDHGFIHSIYTFDPNGLPLEFCYETEDIHQNPVLYDPEPPPAALEGAEAQPGQWPEPQQRTSVTAQQVKAGDGSRFFQKWVER